MVKKHVKGKATRQKKPPKNMYLKQKPKSQPAVIAASQPASMEVEKPSKMKNPVQLADLARKTMEKNARRKAHKLARLQRKKANAASAAPLEPKSKSAGAGKTSPKRSPKMSPKVSPKVSPKSAPAPMEGVTKQLTRKQKNKMVRKDLKAKRTIEKIKRQGVGR
eukprot:TRINITY_DN31254_c0_g1_i1.p2 TRINITY_DN31254_c0_g1~~TRINITY_DN31254_c0_g1_i1.p2  ORF type:complete len:164 (+),score=48.64 TRINITY_DN31254_c0_g1_i1:57-548(+)